MAKKAIGSIADVEMLWNTKEVDDQLRKALAHGLKGAAIFLSSRIKEYLSVPAPRARWTHGSTTSYIALLKNPGGGHPPRKLSGRLRSSITYEVSPDGTEARVGTNLMVGRYSLGRLLEEGWTVRAGTWFPVPTHALLLRWMAGKPSRSPKARPGEIVWIKRKHAQKIGPFPFLVPVMQKFFGPLGQAFMVGASGP